MASTSVKLNNRELFQAEVMDTTSKRMKGLMFSKRVEQPLLFEFAGVGNAENGIHSLFCPEFDAVFLDEAKTIVSIFDKVAPFKWFIKPGAPVKYLLELEPGSVQRLGLRKGVVLDFELED
ncbi:MAG: DUF192 domain-containing protein [Candidatus Micrarchaeota archaeon]